MKNIVTYVQVITLIVIIVSVLLQQKGTGLSGVFGGSANFYQTKRGIEKFLFYTTILASLLFLVVSLWQIYTSK